MANVHSWHNERREDTYHLPGPEHLGWWAAAAVIISIALHVVVFFLLDRWEIALPFSKAKELTTAPVPIRQVEVKPMEDLPPIPDKPVAEPIPESAALLDEIDLLKALPENLEVEMKPDVLDPEYALQKAQPAESGDPAAIARETASSFEIEDALPDFGRETIELPPAAVGQVVINPGNAVVEDDAVGKLTEALIKKGANGDVAKGSLDGVTSINNLLDLPANLLLSKKTMLPSDLLFEFNQAELRESAKIGLMKLALLMDRNPGLYCWIEGHTDLVGGDDFNRKLSKRRAEAVKSYLVDSLRMDSEKIHTRGYGKSSPIVLEGDEEAQAINRRVEIRMRNTPPPAAPETSRPEIQERPPAPSQPIAPPAPQAIPVIPPAAVPVKETPPAAVPVEETPPAAVPVEESPPIALPVAPRARPIR